MSLLIPKVIHQVWLGPNPLPDDFAAYRETWRAHHPEWQLELWTEEHLPHDLRRSEVYDRLRVPAERADILRLEVLWRYGGVYVDTDFECRRPLDPLLDDVDFFTAYLKPGRVNNAIVGATAGHAILDRALDELRPKPDWGYDKHAAGPLFLDRLLKDYPEIRIFEPALFYPSTPGEREVAIAIHHAARSWKDAGGFRSAAQQARRRRKDAERQIGYLTRDLARLRSRTASIERRADSPGVPRAAARMTMRLHDAADATRRLARRVRGAVAFRARSVQQRLGDPQARLGARPRLARFARPHGAVADLRIPRIVHHVWLGTEPVPAEVRRARTSWRINRRWEQRIWTDANLPRGLLREETAEALRSPRERGAFLRLELLHRFGGVAVEPEMVCSQPLDRFLVGAELAIGEPRQADAGAGLLAAVPGHPVVERALRGLPAVEHWGADPASAEALLAETAARAGIAPAVVPATAAAQPSPSDGDDARDVALAAEAALATTQTELDRLRRETEDARSRFARVRGELLVRGRARTRTHESA